MAARNYQPTLRRLSHLLNQFITRYQAQILAGMSPAEATALAALEAALAQILAELGTGGGV